jgi:ribonucleoside-diphosphate reductase alpha chain
MKEYKRPKVLTGKRIKYTTGCGSLYLNLNSGETGKLEEVILTMGKRGSCKNTELFLLGVMLSVLLQSSMPRQKIIKTLRNHWIKTKCDNMFRLEGGHEDITCYDLIANAVLEELEKEKL